MRAIATLPMAEHRLFNIALAQCCSTYILDKIYPGCDLPSDGSTNPLWPLTFLQNLAASFLRLSAMT